MGMDGGTEREFIFCQVIEVNEERR